MANKTELLRGQYIGDTPLSKTQFTTSETQPTDWITVYKTFKGSVDFLGVIPSGSVIVSVRCNSGSTVVSMKSGADWSESGYSNILTPAGVVYGNFTNEVFANYIEEYGFDTIYYRVGMRFSDNRWSRTTGTQWKCSVNGTFTFAPWFEITYKNGEVEKKIRLGLTDPSLGTEYWQPVHTYAPVNTNEGLVWRECEVYTAVNSDIEFPVASDDEQPSTSDFEPVGEDVARKILTGFCGTTSANWNRVKGGDRFRACTFHYTPIGDITVRFSCNNTFMLQRINYDGSVHTINRYYNAGTYEYTITKTTQGFLGFTFMFNNSSLANSFTFSVPGNPYWVKCGEEA